VGSCHLDSGTGTDTDADAGTGTETDADTGADAGHGIGIGIACAPCGLGEVMRSPIQGAGFLGSGVAGGRPIASESQVKTRGEEANALDRPGQGLSERVRGIGAALQRLAEASRGVGQARSRLE